MRVGLHIESRRVAREGSAVLSRGKTVGEVTSGTFSPTLDRPIAMAYVEPRTAASGAQLTVDIRGSEVPAVVVPLPFYKRRGNV
jgi:aminomethyltransferase